jgi:hypothetical protein
MANKIIKAELMNVIIVPAIIKTARSSEIVN